MGNEITRGLVVLGFAILAGCRDPNMPAPPATSADATINPAPSPAASNPVDTNESVATEEERDALGVLNAINEHEIATAQQALDKGVTADVEAFARMMLEQHTDNQQKTAALGADGTGKDAVKQRKAGEAGLAKLAAMSGPAYARAYMDAMVEGHAEALSVLDSKLIPQATTPAVQTHLAETREAVAHHLARAREIISAMKSR